MRKERQETKGDAKDATNTKPTAQKPGSKSNKTGSIALIQTVRTLPLKSSRTLFYPHSLTCPGLKNEWAVTPLIPAPNAGVNYTIPSCLKPGNYLVRHEIIALHSAYNEGGAQFYPGCHQLKVSGEGTKVPSELVSFPGAYDSKDPGIVFSIYNQLPYKIPGPSVFTCE